MGIIIWILFGALVGGVASWLMGSARGGLLSNIAIGIVGALIGGFIMSFFGKGGVGSFNLYSFVVAVLGACVLIAIMRALRR